jgi:transcriptional regulator with XRE-family HTH domain
MSNQLEVRKKYKYRKLPEVIRRAMDMRGMSFPVLAKRMGVSPQTAQTRVDSENPTLETLESVAHGLGLYPDELLLRRRIPPTEVFDEWGTRYADDAGDFDMEFTYTDEWPDNKETDDD